MNPIMIDLGFIQIRWYSFLILIGCIIAYFLVIKQSEKLKISKTELSDLMFYVIIFGILGARIYYCIFNFEYYKYNFLDILKVWEGGLAIHGGIIVGLLVIIIYCIKNKLSILKLTDVFAPSLSVAQAIGRWGNFFNGEAYGAITTSKKLKELFVPQFVIDGMYIQYDYHFPTFYFESLGCLLIFTILVLLKNKKFIRKGQMTGIYCIMYGIIRFFIESTRTDSLMLLNFKVAQIISIIMCIIGLILIIKPYIRKKTQS